MSRRTTPDARRHLYARRCVACGYAGAMLRGGRASRCARCGCDLRSRPARSYAEMEGLQPSPGNLHECVHMIRMSKRIERASDPPRRRSELIERWLWFSFLSMLVLFAIAALAVSATPS